MRGRQRFFLLIGVLFTVALIIYFVAMRYILAPNSFPYAPRFGRPLQPPMPPLPAEVNKSEIVISATGQLAFTYRDKGGVTRVMLNGKVSATYPATETIARPSSVFGNFSTPVHSLSLGAGGSHLGYVLDIKEPADSSKKEQNAATRKVVVIDGKRFGEYLLATPPVFSADGTQVAYAACENGKGWRVWRNGTPGPSFKNIALSFGIRAGMKMGPDWKWDYAGFSTNSRHFCYAGERNDGWYAVVDDREYGPYAMIQGLTFAGDGEGEYLFGFVAGNADNTKTMVVDGRQTPGFSSLLGPVFSADGNHVAFAARRLSEKNQCFISNNGKSLLVNGDISTPPVLSSDGKHMAYIAYNPNGESAAYLDGNKVYSSARGNELGTYFLSSLTFTPDGESIVFYKEFLFSTYSPIGKRVSVNKNGGLVIRGKVTKDYPRALQYTFAPDGTIAYVRHADNDKQQVVLGEHVYPPFVGGVIDLIATAHGSVLYAVHPWKTAISRAIKSNVEVFLNDKLNGSYDEILPYAYDEINKKENTSHLICPADRMQSIVYGNEACFIYDTPNHVHYFAIKGNTIHRVEVELPWR